MCWTEDWDGNPRGYMCPIHYASRTRVYAIALDPLAVDRIDRTDPKQSASSGEQNTQI